MRISLLIVLKNAVLALDKRVNNFNSHISSIIHRSQTLVKAPVADWWTVKLERIENKINLARKKKSKGKEYLKLFFVNNILTGLNVIYTRRRYPGPC